MIGRSGLNWAVLTATTMLAALSLAPQIAASQPLGDPAAASPSALDDSPASAPPPVADAPAAPRSAEMVTVYVTSSPIHSDIIIPRSAFANASPMMRQVAERAKGGPWIIVGWGPYWFGRETEGGPYHQQPILGINSIFTTIVPQVSSRLRVAALDQPGPAPGESSVFMLAVPMTADGLQRALQRVAATIEPMADGSPTLAEQGGVAPGVTVYRSREIYHAVHNCNHWVSEVLAAGGVHDAVVFDVLPESLYLALRAAGATPATPDDLARATEVELRREAAIPADIATR